MKIAIPKGILWTAATLQVHQGKDQERGLATTFTVVTELAGDQNHENVITHKVPALMRNCPLKRKKSLFLW